MTAEFLQTGATEFRTPLGTFRVMGPHGPAPFAVSRHPVPASHKGALKQYYSLSISLDELIAGEAYVVEFDGPKAPRRTSRATTSSGTTRAKAGSPS